MARKPVKRAESRAIVYDKNHWDLLRGLRSRATKIMEILAGFHLRSIVHGSVARGDVSTKSDIDIFLPNPSSSFIIETALESSGSPFHRRIIIQATPLYAAKGYLEVNEQIQVSFPLAKLRQHEKDFYRFGGEASIDMIRKNLRVTGVDKRLMLIVPTALGHLESNIIGNEEAVASILGISHHTVLDRVHALLRRDEVGRTGVFIERELTPDETFEMVLKRLADQNPAVRRRLRLAKK